MNKPEPKKGEAAGVVVKLTWFNTDQWAIPIPEKIIRELGWFNAKLRAAIKFTQKNI